MIAILIVPLINLFIIIIIYISFII